MKITIKFSSEKEKKLFETQANEQYRAFVDQMVHLIGKYGLYSYVEVEFKTIKKELDNGNND